MVPNPWPASCGNPSTIKNSAPRKPRKVPESVFRSARSPKCLEGPTPSGPNAMVPGRVLLLLRQHPCTCLNRKTKYTNEARGVRVTVQLTAVAEGHHRLAV